MIKKLTKGLKGHKNLVFLDFEGTQFSHEMIALGGIAVTIDPKTGRIKKRKKPIRIYVLAKNKIGNYVVNLTGITEETLRSKGVIFDTAMRELKKYCGISFKKSTFITFGNHDLRILNQSISYNIKYPKDVTSQIQKNYFDFGAFISEFIRDEKGNPLSLVHYCEMFKVPEYGQAHDPEVDAVNLANLYDAFIANTQLVAAEYKKYLIGAAVHYPDPVAEAIKSLASGKDYSAKKFNKEIDKYIS